jgi:6-phosphogluconolactonase
VHPSDSRSNYRLARERLLDRLSRLPRAVHRVRGELEPQEAASLYHDELDGIRLGLAFQGIGPDGHTASLFPGDPALAELERRAVAVHRPDVDRVTLTLPVLCAAEIVLFLVLGEGKADAARAAFVEPPGPQTPASLVRSAAGRTVALLDRAAATGLPS